APPRRRARGAGSDSGVARAARRGHPRRPRPRELRGRGGGRALRGPARAGRAGARRRPGRADVVPRRAGARAVRAARSARRRARVHPRHPRHRGRRQRLRHRPADRGGRAAVNFALARVGGRTFASVRKHRNYRLYFAGQAVSFTGTWMQQIAASWLVLQLTHSAVAVGALALVQLAPVTAFGLFVGTLVDRLDVRRTAIACETLSLANAAVLAALTVAHVVAVWEIFALVGLQGLVNALDGPARHSLIFQMVGPADLPNAVALS